jgi:lipopolysaccharide export system ATP-binding protein
MATLHAQSLKKSYKNRTVVQDVSLHVGAGEVVGLLGPNGAGKTTCFYMIVGLVQADAGQVLLDDEDVTPLAMHARAQRGIGYLPQEPSIFRKLTTRQNIEAILEIRKDLSKSSREALCDELLKEFNITHVADSLGISLSGGERRRVEIARAVAANPAFMLLDEPFAGVDPISVLDIRQIIQQLSQRGIGILITDHNVRETLSICQRAYIVAAGQVIATGGAEEILQNEQVREIYLGEEFTL